MSLPRFSVQNPVLVNLLMLVIIAAGMVCALTLTREMFPESRPEKLLITTIYPGVSPQEIEKVLTIKIEEAVRDAEGVDKVDSTVIEGMSATRLSLLPGIRNVDRVLQEVKAEIDAIEDLPVDAEKTTVKKLEPKLPVIGVAIYGPGSDADRKRAARALRDELLLLPGVSDVVMSGAKEDEISVEIRPAKLMEYDITFDEVAAAIRQANLDVTGGQIDASRSSLSIRTLGEEQRGVDLNKIIVRSFPDGRTVYLSDVADVRDAFVDIDQEGYFNGEPGINCVVYQNNGVTVTAFLVDHAPVKPALGYRVDFGGRSVVISGDTTASDNLVKFAKGVDLLVHEIWTGAASTDIATSLYHTTPEQAASVFSRAAPKLALLTHFAPMLADVTKNIRSAGYGGPLQMGADLLSVEVGDQLKVNPCSTTATPVASAATSDTNKPAITADGTIIVWGSAFTPEGGNSLRFTRAGTGPGQGAGPGGAGQAATVIDETSNLFFWDKSATQINAALGGKLAAGQWNLVVRNGCGVSSAALGVTIQ